MLRILITGGFGLIGSRLGQYLASKGHQIILGSREKKNIPEWLPNSKVLQMNWTDIVALERCCDNIDIIIHTAASDAKSSYADPYGALEFNGLATARLINASIKQKVNRFIYLSTAHVYCDPLIGVITEETCVKNIHPYASSHKAAEDIILFATKNSELKSTILRLSNTFGRVTHDSINCWDLFVYNLCRQVVETDKMIISNSGNIQRNFITLDDVCGTIDHILHFTNVLPPIINVGGTRSHSLIEMADLIKNRCELLINISPEIHYKNNNDQNELDYRINNLLNIGYNLKSNFNKEIDELLILCNKWFKKY
jgi:UDP-glucose 4-epimerase